MAAQEAPAETPPPPTPPVSAASATSDASNTTSVPLTPSLSEQPAALPASEDAPVSEAVCTDIGRRGGDGGDLDGERDAVVEGAGDGGTGTGDCTGNSSAGDSSFSGSAATGAGAEPCDVGRPKRVLSQHDREDREECAAWARECAFRWPALLMSADASARSSSAPLSALPVQAATASPSRCSDSDAHSSAMSPVRHAGGNSFASMMSTPAASVATAPSPASEADSVADTEDEGAVESIASSASKDKLRLSEADLHTIRVDIPRTRAGDPAFANPRLRSRLDSLLTGFCEEEGLRYMQGMHEVAGIFAYVEAASSPNLASPELAAGSDVRPFDGAACFAAFVRNFVHCFYDGDGFVLLHVLLLFFRQLLLYHHPDLHNQLEEVGVSPIIYATPWFITLFASRTPLSVLLHLWDRYITKGDDTFLPFLALAIMATEKVAILSAEEDETNLAVDRASLSSLDRLDVVWNFALTMQRQTPQSFVVRMRRVVRKVKDRCAKTRDSGVGKPDKPWTESVLARVEQERRLAVMPSEVVAHFARQQQQQQQQ
mmetsp:Transcript_92609/g.249863  ORF Transcript_92609/g.249863 Transcript_92609/m.249863 type:complete len:545 (-) Transcript_92609:178-1812(-)